MPYKSVWELSEIMHVEHLALVHEIYGLLIYCFYNNAHMYLYLCPYFVIMHLSPDLRNLNMKFQNK